VIPSARLERNRVFPQLLRGSVVALAFAAACVPVEPAWVERVYSRSIYLSLQSYLTAASNLLPIALLDVAIGLLLVWLAAAFLRDRRHRARRPAMRAAVRLGVSLALIYLLFVATWGLNYRRLPLEATVAFDRARVTEAAAIRLATTAVARVNAEHAAAHAAVFDADALAAGFADAQRFVGAPRRATLGKPKWSLAGLYFRQAAIDGMTVPVFLEVILNPDLLAVERPSVLAHEWAHLAGYADESEASFIGWVAGVRSEDPVARYSAWLDAYGLASTALPRDVRAAIPPLDPGPRADLRAIAARYDRSSLVVRRAARGVYDSYLKANRVEEGIESYAAALKLILGSDVGALLAASRSGGDTGADSAQSDGGNGGRSGGGGRP
jgi:uncharacterized membrane protein YgcG